MIRIPWAAKSADFFSTAVSRLGGDFFFLITDHRKRVQSRLLYALIAFVLVTPLHIHASAAEVQADASGKYTQQAGPCSAALSPGITLHVPLVTIGDASAYATFGQVPTTDGSIVLKLTAAGQPVRSDCSDWDTAMLMPNDEGRWLLHIPSLVINSTQIWVNLEHVPTANGELWFKVIGFGPGGTWSGEAGMYMVLSKTELLDLSDTSFRVREIFPGGLTAELSASFLGNQSYSPSAAEIEGSSQNVFSIYGFQISTESFGDAYHSVFSYFVPANGVPPASRGPESALNEDTAEAGSGGKKFGASDAQSWVKVYSEVSFAADKKVLQWLLEHKFKEAGKIAGKAGGATLDVIGAWNLRSEHNAWMERLDALQRCVENYNWDLATVNVKDALLDQINSARQSLKANTGTRFVIAEATVASSVIPHSWVLTSGVKGNTDASLQRENERLVKSLEEYIMSHTKGCKQEGYRVLQEYGGGGISGSICSLERSFKLEYVSEALTGTFSFTPSTALSDAGSLVGTWKYDGSYGSVAQHTGNGTYKVLSHADGVPQSIYILPYSLTLCTPVGCATNSFGAENFVLQKDPAACVK